MKRTQEEVESLRGKLRKIEQRICPRRKFKFSCRDPPTSSAPKIKVSMSVAETGDHLNDLNLSPDHAATGSASAKIQSKAQAIPIGSYAVSQRDKEEVDITLDDFPNLESKNSAQLFINECKSTLVSAPCPLGSVRLENLTDCAIVLGPCRTSIYLENCINCRIFLVCHQLRIHNTHKCQLFVLVNSAPIIEDCSQLEFGPNRITYSGLSEHLQESGLVEAKHWNDVIDFRWHKSVASPHWRALLPVEYERVKLPDSVLSRGWSLRGPSHATSTSNASTASAMIQQSEACSSIETTVGIDDDDEDEI